LGVRIKFGKEQKKKWRIKRQSPKKEDRKKRNKHSGGEYLILDFKTKITGVKGNENLHVDKDWLLPKAKYVPYVPIPASCNSLQIKFRHFSCYNK
jgi:hypothetical protein